MLNFLSAKDMGIDLGTANTLIYIKDNGIVLNEPSVIALDKRRNVTLAVGDDAKEMIGKAPANIMVVRPLRAFIDKAVGNKIKNFRVVVGVPSGVTEVEKRAVEGVVRQMGASEVYILEEPMAAAIGAGLDVDSSTACMICDIGGGTTDIAIIASTSIRHAGDKFNEAIIQYVRKRYALMIGEKTAEMLKIEAGAACLDIDENGDEIIKTVQASGRDIISGLPKSIEVTNRDIMLGLQESIDIVIDGVKATIEKAPPEIAADIASSGMVLSGGGGRIYNLDKLIEKRTSIKATVAENTFEAVALGTGMSLNNVETLKIHASSVKRR